MSKILVVGSSNTDLIAKMKKFPKAGETIEGLSYMQAMGGKGANQAIAAHRLGGDVNFITCLGDDANGQNTLKYYNEEGIDVSSAIIVEGVSSGTAMIFVDEQGENCIVITPGANNSLSPDYISIMEEKIAETEIVVLQMEIPYDTVKTVCALAKKHKKTVILNDAPARKLDEEILKTVDVLVVNEMEAETISGEKIESVGKEFVLEKLVSMGATSILLTLGKEGSLLKKGKISISMDAFKVEALDTTAAGDTFCGALAARLSKGEEWHEALRFASAASAICVTRMGAQPSIPTEEEVFAFLSENS
ncbi:ribokinase [Marinifilum caeruleilacunae]|uniref:Ribokinase n=1 Tax=Marinifilum caeruleilacunae TaxID=2499076 RepID=A0ABX1X1R6_9BACT|nr:ribokinase [Marinifilum caeruleilacunae]NOU62259.1 ribokinase [Marinifilum caeruleilacunae]